MNLDISRKQLKKDIYGKLLLKDASLFQIFKCLVKKTFDSGEFWFGVSVVLLVIMVWIRINR